MPTALSVFVVRMNELGPLIPSTCLLYAYTGPPLRDAHPSSIPVLKPVMIRSIKRAAGLKQRRRRRRRKYCLYMDILA
jgi:hypothetical protein